MRPRPRNKIDADTLFDVAWQRACGIADESLRQRALNADAIDAIDTALAVPMGQSRS